MLNDTVLVYCNAAYFSGGFGFGEQAHQVSYDKSAIFTAKCVVFHLPSLTELDYHSLPWLHKRKKPGQLWVKFSAESAANYPALTRPELAAMFDLEMSYRQCADIWTPYLDANTLATVHSAKVMPKRHFAVAFISSNFNKSGRVEYLQELMNYIPVHSYGAVLNNRSSADLDQGADTQGMHAKLDISAHYRFSLAFENSICPDYVTEKFYQPLRVGSIPVYLGAPNVSEFSPAPNCYINVADFSDPKALAAYLLSLDDDDYHHWRSQAASTSLADKLERLSRQGTSFDALYQRVFG